MKHSLEEHYTCDRCGKKITIPNVENRIVDSFVLFKIPRFSLFAFLNFRKPKDLNNVFRVDLCSSCQCKLDKLVVDFISEVKQC